MVNFNSKNIKVKHLLEIHTCMFDKYLMHILMITYNSLSSTVLTWLGAIDILPSTLGASALVANIVSNDRILCLRCKVAGLP